MKGLNKVSLEKLMLGSQFISKCQSGAVYRLRNGEIFKLFSPTVLRFLNSDGSLERKIISAKPIKGVSEIRVPTRYAVDRYGCFAGYACSYVDGPTLNEFVEDATLAERMNLMRYGRLFYDLSDAVRRANQKGIIFPDLCTCDNIIISGGKIHFIDYDGLQIGRHKGICMSTTLGNQEQYYNEKYSNGDYFTPELDKKSILLLYFLATFNVNLSKVGQIDYFTGEVITLEAVFEMLGIEDEAFLQKAKMILSPDEKGDYIGEDVLRIASEYEMKSVMPPIGGNHVVKLFKK